MPATIFSGSKVKTLKGTLTLNDQADIITGTANPQTSATAGNPGSLYLKTDSGDVYRKLDSGSSTNWLLVGSEGSAGINIVGLNSTYQLQSPTDRNAEVSVGNWATYDDGAVAAPVDMTGGSPSTITLSRTTTAGEVLNGVASFKVVKTAADGQGEGWSVLCNIPEGYRGRQVAIKFPFKLISGTLVQGDLKLYAYDVTNSVVITPVNNDVFGSRSAAIALFSTSTNTAQVRVGFHLATTAATAFTISWDDVEVTPTSEALGVPSTEWTAFSMSITSTGTAPVRGTVVREEARWRRVGDSMEIYFDYEQSAAGTGGTGTYLFGIPGGYSIDTAKLTPTTTSIQGIVGHAAAENVGSVASEMIVKAYNSTSLALVEAPHSSGPQVVNGTTFFGFNVASLRWTLYARVPISGWSSNVTIASSSTFSMSSILANGTRVTATPTRLGEYRSKYKTAASNNYSAWTDSAPTDAPSSANGIRIYALRYADAGTAGQINAYEIFVGKNKTVKVLGFKDTGFTNAQDITRHPVDLSVFGIIQDYDPTSGVLYVSGANTGGGSTGTSYFGWDADSTSPTNGYLDVIVSENALAVGIQMPRSEVLAHTGNGHGSTNTKVRRFTSSSAVGSAITYADSATNGGSFTVNETGVYSVTYSDSHTSAANIGISVDSSTLTTNIESVTIANGKKVIGSLAANGYIEVSCDLNLNAGSVIRAHTDGTPANATDNVIFRVTKVSN